MRNRFGTAAVAAAAFLWACGGGGGGEAGGEDVATESEPTNGDMLVVGTPVDLDTMFPPTSNSASASDIWGHIYWPLLRSEADFIHFRPGLADSFAFSDDSLAVTFHLRPGLTWHDGHPLDAEDVTFAYDVYTEPVINFSSISWLESITEVEAVDSLTVRFHYDERYMYQVLDAVIVRPLPEHILGDVPYEEMPDHEIARRPVGNGPFRFVSWTSNQEFVMEAYPEFAPGRAHLNRVSFRIIPESTNLATQIQNGQVDLWPRFSPVSLYPQFQQDPDVNVESFPGRSYTYLAYNTEDPLFEDKRVRQAITLAIDRDQIVEALVYGQGSVGTQPMISTIWAHDPSIEPYPFDPDSARALLEAAGWADSDGDGVLDKDGRPFSFRLKTNVDNRLRVDIVTVVQDQLEDIGVEVRPDPLEFNTFIDQLLESDFQAAVGGWVVGIKAELKPTFGTGELFNFVQAENARLDSLIAAAQTELDREEAKRIWGEAQRIIVDEAYYTFLFQLNSLHVIDKRFRNVDMNAYGWGFNLEEWWVPEGRQRYDVPVGSSPIARTGGAAETEEAPEAAAGR